MNELTEQEFWAALDHMPKPMPISYRLYYNDTGLPIIYTMEDLPGNYIEVDQKTYVSTPFNVRVVEGKLIYVEPTVVVNKLQPTDSDGTACDPKDVSVVVKEDQPHTKWTTVNNEIN